PTPASVSATARESSAWRSSTTTSTAARTTSTPTSSGRCEALGLGFAPEAQRFLRGAVRVAEDHAVAHRLETVDFPRRTAEAVVRRETEAPRANLRLAPPFDDAAHGAVGAAAGAPGESLRQPLHEDRHGREGIAAGHGVRVAELPAVRGMRISV